MKAITNRRNAIKSTIAASLAAMMPSFPSLKAEHLHTQENFTNLNNSYLVKHGHPFNDNTYLWSLMTVNNETAFLGVINSIITSNNYYSKLSYNSNDKFKVAPAKQIIDFIWNTNSGVVFEMTLFSGNPSQFINLNPSASNLKKSQLYSNILANKSNLKVVSKAEDRFGPSDAYNNKFAEIHNAAHESVNTKFNPFLQVNDLISGICYSILTNRSIHSSAKLELNSYFEQKTNLSTQKNNSTIILNNIIIKKSNVG